MLSSCNYNSYFNYQMKLSVLFVYFLCFCTFFAKGKNIILCHTIAKLTIIQGKINNYHLSIHLLKVSLGRGSILCDETLEYFSLHCTLGYRLRQQEHIMAVSFIFLSLFCIKTKYYVRPVFEIFQK